MADAQVLTGKPCQISVRFAEMARAAALSSSGRALYGRLVVPRCCHRAKCFGLAVGLCRGLLFGLGTNIARVRETSLAGAGRSGIHLPPARQWHSRGSDDVEGPERSMALR